jgi:hypothetical protein
MLIQPLVNYNLPHAWYFTFSPIITANWKADKGDDVWTVPLGTGVEKVFRIGKLPPMNAQVLAYYNVAKPVIRPAQKETISRENVHTATVLGFRLQLAF